jgi:hypothetical protein
MEQPRETCQNVIFALFKTNWVQKTEGSYCACPACLSTVPSCRWRKLKLPVLVDFSPNVTEFDEEISMLYFVQENLRSLFPDQYLLL